MNDHERKNMLADLKARQVKQEHMPCPRCGKDTMGEDPMRNALSRQADVMVCDSCGQNEAVEKRLAELAAEPDFIHRFIHALKPGLRAVWRNREWMVACFKARVPVFS